MTKLEFKKSLVNDMKAGIERLRELLPSRVNELILLDARLHAAKQNRRLGILNAGDLEVEMNRIRNAILEFADEVKFPYSSTPSTTYSPQKHKQMPGMYVLKRQLSNCITKVRFKSDYQDVKESALALRERVLNFRAEKDKDQMYDASGEEERAIWDAWDQFGKDYSLRLERIDLLEKKHIRDLLGKVEGNLSKDSLGAVIEALTGYDAEKYQYLNDSLDRVSSTFALEKLAGSVFEIVENL